tara:strand:+ start:1293 stop:1541 length:249 start_codon:yes stop_codon:yes gene_type:complete
MTEATMEMVAFAEKYELKPIEAMFLAGLFEKAVEVSEKPLAEVVKLATCNAEVGGYIAELARKVGATPEAAVEYKKFAGSAA